MKFFLCVLGMVMVIEGLPYFAFPEKMKFWIEKILELSDGTLRKFGFVLMLSTITICPMTGSHKNPPHGEIDRNFYFLTGKQANCLITDFMN